MNYLLVTEQSDNHLRVYEQVDEGALVLWRVLDVPGGPASFVVNHRTGLLHVATRDDPGMNTYRIGAGCEMQLLGRIELPTDPCFTNVDRSGHWLLTTYFADGSLRINAIGVDGLPTADGMTTLKTYVGAHCIRATSDNRYLLVPHVGSNCIMQFRFDQGTGAILANDPAEVEPVGWQTPRHLTLHPLLPMAYTSNEKGSSITAWKLGRGQGTLTELQTSSTLPADWDGVNTCAQIHMCPDGRYVYVSNRGHDSLVRYAVDAESGLLTVGGWTQTEAIPRAFCLDQTGRFLYVGGRDTGWLVAYARNPNTGELVDIGRHAVGQRVMWIQSVSLPI